MGAICCPCMKQAPDTQTYKVVVPSEQSERTPLLAHIPAPPRAPPTSARYKPADEELDNVLDDNEPNLDPVEIQLLGVPDVDKHFKVTDHASLYNEYVSKYRELLDCLYKLDGDKDNDFADIRTSMREVVTQISEEGKQHMKLSRRFQYCMEITYEGQYLTEHIVVKLQSFNRANRLIKELIDKKKPMIDSVAMVLDSEDKIKRDVFVHCTDSQHAGRGAEFWKVCLINLRELRRVKPAATYIYKQAQQSFEQLVLASAILFSDNV